MFHWQCVLLFQWPLGFQQVRHHWRPVCRKSAWQWLMVPLRSTSSLTESLPSQDSGKVHCDHLIRKGRMPSCLQEPFGLPFKNWCVSALKLYWTVGLNLWDLFFFLFFDAGPNNNILIELKLQAAKNRPSQSTCIGACCRWGVLLSPFVDIGACSCNTFRWGSHSIYNLVACSSWNEILYVCYGSEAEK